MRGCQASPTTGKQKEQVKRRVRDGSLILMTQCGYRLPYQLRLTHLAGDPRGLKLLLVSMRGVDRECILFGGLIWKTWNKIAFFFKWLFIEMINVDVKYTLKRLCLLKVKSLRLIVLELKQLQSLCVENNWACFALLYAWVLQLSEVYHI